MKSFLIKALVFLIAQSLIVLGIVAYLDRKHGLPFVSNSISYNLKAKFLSENRELLQRSRIKVIGSSMSLNNIDCQMLSDSLGVPVINLAAWNMKFSDYSDFDIWKTGSVILMNMHFTDLGTSSLLPKKGFPYGGGAFTNFSNILSDFKTYRDNLQKQTAYTSSQVNDYYDSHQYDKTGTVVYTEYEDFNLDNDRWEGELNEYTEQNMAKFIREVSKKAALVDRLVISFSPPISRKRTEPKSRVVKEIERSLGSMPNVVFVDAYHSGDFVDTDFVDFCHFSRSGTRKLTGLILAKLREKRVLP